MDPAGWSGGFDDASAFGAPFNGSQSHEDWEDWLRWDPAAEPTSPEDGTLNSASSKNDSPIQDTLLPADVQLLRKANETLAPPMIMGEDGLDFGGQTVAGNEPFLFGAPDDATPDFDFQSLTAMEQPHLSMMPKIDTTSTAWPPLLPSNADSQNINLSALSNDNYHTLPSAGTVSSNPPSLHYSPESSSQNRTSISSNSPDPPKKRGGRKRKAEIEPEPRESNGDSQEDGDEPPIKKTSHNVIEKRYRNNLNDKIVELRNSVPSLRAMKKLTSGQDDENLEGLTAAHKLNKATVMAKATEYIKHLEKRNTTMADEMAALKARLAAVEAAIGNTRDRSASMSGSPPSGTLRPRQASSSSQTGVQGFLNVPQEQSRFNQQVVQQQYMQPQQHPTYARQPGPPAEAQNQAQYVNARGGGGGVINKVALGTMAGLMVMEGFSESQPGDQSTTKALFGVPVPQLFRRALDISTPSSAAAFARQATLPLLKTILVIGILLYLLAPLLSFSPRRKQKTRATTVRLPHAPSLASPIEVRRKAWLTAIQTVWVPKHFLLEVVAVTAKMISLSLRRLIGSGAFNSLTGANKDDETARIKAWDIAIDAQLAGGDAEVGYYRLLLTLMESGTLPDSPTRLMQKAVHFRLFFWDMANAGYGNIIGFKQFTEKVGRLYWDSARRLQKELVHAKSQGRPNAEEMDDEVDRLPNHLASLVELDCDEVLSDEMIQRAWNLAWNKPSANRTVANAARDAVVEDHAIRSPLDAVAAWYANMSVDETLAESLSEHASTLDTEYYIGLAVSVAPPASATQARALAAKAVLSNTNRKANILAALEALPAVSPSPSEGQMNVVSHLPASPDVCTALTLAKLLALSSPTAPQAGRERALQTIAALHLPPGNFTLLTAVAAYRLLHSLVTADARQCRNFSTPVKRGLEDLAANLRVWVGWSAARIMGREECARVVEMCFVVAKEVGGWGERDSGYGGSVEGSPVRGKGEVGVGIGVGGVFMIG